MEPFVGGGSVFLEAVKTGKFEKFIISDLNKSVSDFWNHGIHANEEVYNFANELRCRFETGRELHSFLISSDFQGPENAAKFFLLNRITYSGLTESGGYSQACYDQRLTPGSFERLSQLAELQQFDVQVFSLDYEELEYQPTATVYLDPPYASAEQFGLYGVDGNLHAGFDHSRFFDFFDSLEAQGIATYDSSEQISYLLEGRGNVFVKEFTLNYSLSRRQGKSGKSGLELLIANFPIEELFEKAS